MCRKHWYELPKRIRDAIWREYKPGQERTKQPTARYLAVQQLAIARVAFKANDEQAAAVAANYLARAAVFQQKAIDAGDGDPLDGLVC